MSTLFQDAICFFTTSRSTALIEHVFLLLRAVKGSARRFVGNCGRWAERGPLGGLGRRPSKLGPTGSVRASFMHVAGHTCSESRDMNTKYYLVSLDPEASKLVSRLGPRSKHVLFRQADLPLNACIGCLCILNRVKESRHYFHIALSCYFREK